MSDDNKNNLLYFEAASMKGLYDTMEEWQKTNRKRLLSSSIQNDKGQFCCIALTNPTEVYIRSGEPPFQAQVTGGSLDVNIRR